MFISTVEKNMGIIWIKHLLTEKNDNIFHIINQIKVQGYRCESNKGVKGTVVNPIKVSRVPLWIKHCHMVPEEVNFPRWKELNRNLKVSAVDLEFSRWTQFSTILYKSFTPC